MTYGSSALCGARHNADHRAFDEVSLASYFSPV